jgi:hypothetical protein
MSWNDGDDRWCTAHNEPLREDCWTCRDKANESYWAGKVRRAGTDALRKALGVCEGISYDAVEKLLREAEKTHV